MERKNLMKDNILRCISCDLIPSLSLNFYKGIPLINLICENNHTEQLYLKDYLNKCHNFSLSNKLCKICNKSQSKKKTNDKLFYCSDCNDFICNICLKEHNNEHFTINIKRYDSFCKKHSNFYTWFCKDCFINICALCYPKHQSHNLILLTEYEYTNQSLINKIKDYNNAILNIKELEKKIITLFKKLKDSLNLEINYLKKLYITYEYEKKQKNLNYYVIDNLINLEELSKLSRIQKIYDETNKYITQIKNFIEYPLNNLVNCVTNIKTHKKSISFLNILQDGRLISSSYDNILNIYNKNTFEVELSINEYSNKIYYITQLKNGEIVSCYEDGTIQLIKLLDKNHYQITNTYKDYNNIFKKIIEMENELISLSVHNLQVFIYNNSNNSLNISNINYFQSNNNSFNYKSNTHINYYNYNYNNYDDNHVTIDYSYINDYTYNNILKLNENEFVTSSTDNILRFWKKNTNNINYYHYLNTSKINNIVTGNSLSSMCIIANDILCIGGINNNGFYLIKISTNELLNKISGPETIFSIIKCYDGLSLCSFINNDGKNFIGKFEYKNKDLKFRIKISVENEIYSCVELEGQIIATGDNNGLIKIWGM